MQSIYYLLSHNIFAVVKSIHLVIETPKYLNLDLTHKSYLGLAALVCIRINTHSLMSNPPSSILSPSSPVTAAPSGSGARVGPPWLPSPCRPLQAAAGAAGEPAEREGGGSAEGEREGGRGEREGGAEGGGELLRQSAPVGWLISHCPHPPSL